jgi:hypothetical protein
MRTPIVIVLLAATSITAFAAGQQSKTVDSLHTFNDRFNTSVVAGDAPDLIDLYADDGTTWKIVTDMWHQHTPATIAEKVDEKNGHVLIGRTVTSSRFSG